MISFSDGIRHLYMPGLKDISHDIKFGVNDWLAYGKDYQITSPVSTSEVTLRTFDIQDYLRSYAFDINRLSCASVESLNDIQKHPSSPKFNGWTITKYYYSAFFSAHSILRLTNNGIMNIDAESISKINEITKNYGQGIGSLKKGLFCNTITNGSDVTFTKDPQYDESHKGLWKRFLHFITNIQTGIYSQLPQSDAQLVVNKLEELKDSLTNWGTHSGEWLSRMRNLNNYSQDFGVWYPYKGYSKQYEEIIKSQDLCKENPLRIDIANHRGKELIYFVKTCQLINSMNFDLQKDLVTRHPTNKSFLLHGVFEYHKHYVKSTKLIS